MIAEKQFKRALKVLIECCEVPIHECVGGLMVTSKSNGIDCHFPVLANERRKQ